MNKNFSLSFNDKSLRSFIKKHIKALKNNNMEDHWMSYNYYLFATNLNKLILDENQFKILFEYFIKQNSEYWHLMPLNQIIENIINNSLCPQYIKDKFKLMELLN